ncbi:MAG: hypothetical protein F2839_00435 [Actinobacteria bacterium]|nr:hypothetical protein [Actinomycetota bacterium]
MRWTKTLTLALTLSLPTISSAPAFADDPLPIVVTHPLDGTMANVKHLAGYAGQSSVLPGENLSLHVLSRRTYSILVNRIGSYGGGNGSLIFSQLDQPAVSQPAPKFTKKTRMVECHWSATQSLDTTTYVPGLYVVRLESTDGFALIPFVVRTANPSGTTLMKVGLLSLQVYNEYGKYSAYEGGKNRKFGKRSYVVSLNRPIDPLGYRTFKQFEVPIATAVDRTLPNASWTTDYDVATGATPLAGVRSIVTGGHDEYWPVSERKAVENAIKAGTNFFVTGANTMYWRVRLQSGPDGPNRRIAIYKEKRKDPVKKSQQTTVRWRDSPKVNPESAVMGTSYMQWWYHCRSSDRPWNVVDANWWGYADTGVVSGQQIAGLVGREVDQIVSSYPVPRHTQVIAHGTYKCKDTGKRFDRNHDATYITTNSGGAIFASGSQRWPCAVNGACATQWITPEANAFAKKVTENILLAFDAGPAGITNPATYNVKSVTGKRPKRLDW